jgi:FkbM family methyltransferase
MHSYAGAVALPDSEEARAVYHEVVEADCYRLGQLHDSGFRPRLVWDLGASWGVASVVLAHWWPGATVWAFEPVPDRYRQAVANTRHLANVHVFNVGLFGFLHRDDRAAVEGIAYDGVWRESPQSYLRSLAAYRCTSVSAFLDENPLPRGIDLIKVDIEGCEIGVLRELQQLGLLEAVQHIRGEWHFNAFDEIPRILAGSHYTTMTPSPDNPWHYFDAVRVKGMSLVFIRLEG